MSEIMPAIPPRLEAVLDLVRSHSGGELGSYYGIAEFYAPKEELKGADLLDALTDKRWPGMHSDLIPFANDGTGNLFCLVNGRSKTAKHGAVVHWMYETYSATPIASSFDHFLDWIWLTANYTARHGIDDAIDMQNVETRLTPLLSELRYHPASLDLMIRDRTLYGLHKAMVASDRRAAASLLTGAFLGSHPLHDMRTLERMRMAAEAFPEYTAAHMAMVSAFRAQSHESEVMTTLLDAIHSPLVYGGDRLVPYIGDIPEVDATQIAEMLATHPELQEWSIIDPIWEVVLRDDPTDPVAWLAVAVEYANNGLLEDAVIKAQNAMFMGLNVSEAVDIVTLLCELYDALGWDWHLHAAEKDLYHYQDRFS